MKVMMACGGTGGHIFPALAIAEEFIRLFEAKVCFAGRSNSMESRLLQDKYEYLPVKAVPFHRGSVLENLLLPVKLGVAIFTAFRNVRRWKPDVVVATGGYVSLPTILAAKMLAVPVYLQEQNAVAGIANRIGAKFARRVFVTSEDAQKAFPFGVAENFGNPVRKIPENPEAPAEISAEQKLVLVLGGSQGARGINRKMEELIPQFKNRPDIYVIWQAGEKNIDTITDENELPENVKVVGFVENIYSYINRADVIVSRAGASTLAEILAFGKPSVLVPFPFATANHQEHNARAVESKGAAMVELDDEANGLWEKVSLLLDNADKKRHMENAASALGVRDAGEKIAQRIADLEGLK